MKPPVMDRRSLIDIGASGPLSGFLISIIAVIVGLNFSEPAGEELSKGEFVLGPSFIFYFLVRLILGPESFPVSLHPVAFAGWVGLLITSLNLFPIGQLDGGHIAYALFGERHRWVSISMIPLLFLLGLIFWPGWLMWALLMFILGLNHPPVVHPEIPLDRKRKLIGYLALAVFILAFAPIPFGEI
jgi:membrane-associated protease RseP (regulator of RpoE activity)